MSLVEDENAYAILGCALRVHSALGSGFLESAYGDALEIEFRKNNIPFVREDEIRVFYDGAELKTRYRADFTCYNQEYLVELKAIRRLTKIEWAQVFHYVKATNVKAALLINFGALSLQYDFFERNKILKH